MKTAESIEAQEERKKDEKDTRADEGKPRETTPPVTRSKNRGGDFSRIAKWAWKPGQSGNPGGRPREDTAARIPRDILENNEELIY